MTPPESLIPAPRHVEIASPPSARRAGPPLPPLGRANLPTFLRLAQQLHQAGHLADAERIDERILEADSAHSDAHHLLGIVCHQRGEHERALRHLRRASPASAGLFRHLGEVYRALRRLDEAGASFERALALEPGDPDCLVNLGHVHLQGGDAEAAAACYARALGGAPADAELLTCHGTALARLGRDSEAEASYRAALDLDPDRAETAHLLAALTGDAAGRAPREYVAALFDGYADTFDADLVGALRYDVPQRLRRAVDTVEPGRAGRRVADLGCGTGLCGATFRDVAATLVGVDLSPKMIERARERGIYDALLEDDLCAALAPPHAPFDLVVAADVLIYTGDLSPVLAAARGALSPGGLLAFSTERDEGDSWRLRRSGRFAHGEAYVRRTAEDHRLDVERVEEIEVRLEQATPVAGHLFVLRRTA